MSVIEKLKSESIRLRKERNTLAPAIGFTLSEIDRVGKNAGNRATTDDEAISVIQKQIAIINENLKLDIDDGRKIAFASERQVLLSVLPQMASDDEIKTALREVIGETAPANKGIAMKVIKERFGAKVDMRHAGTVVTELYGI